MRKEDGRVRASSRLARFLADDRADIAPLAAIMIPLLLVALGAATDYTSAARRQETLQSISDAAVLASTQPAMMSESCYPNSTSPSNPTACGIVQQQVVNVFNAQAASVWGSAGSSGSGAPTITTANVSIVDSGNQRTSTVTWNETSVNLFGGILGMPNFAIQGESVAKNGSPVTLFYMLIDNTPSMAFPAQAAGVTDMVNLTPANSTGGSVNGGCALGCHESVPGASVSDDLYNPSNIQCASASTWAATDQFACVLGTNSYLITGGTYVSSSGLVTLTLATSPGLAKGSTFYVNDAGQVTSTGGPGPGLVTQANGAWTSAIDGGGTPTTPAVFTAGTGTSGTTVTYTTTTGLGNATLAAGGYVVTTPVSVPSGGSAKIVGAPGQPFGCATNPNATQYSGTIGSSNAIVYEPTAGTPTFANYFGAEDSFAMARCLNVQLRVDLVNQAVASLMTTAPQMAITNNTTYAVDIYALDLGNNNTPTQYANGYTVTNPSVADVGLVPIYFWGCATTYQVTPSCTGSSGSTIVTQTDTAMNTNFGYATTAANTLAPLETYQSGLTTSTTPNYNCGDNDSPIDLALQYLYSGTGAISPACGATGSSTLVTAGTPAITSMATPGNGLPAAGNTPQEVLFIVSDAMNDVTAAGGSYPSVSSGSNPSVSCLGASKVYDYYGRPMFCANQTTDGAGNTYCTDIKNKGIRIAFLYLRYNTLDSNATSQPSNGYYYDIEPWQYPGNSTDKNNADFPGTYTDEVEQGAIACASTGLEFTVDTDTNINTAMTTLFQKAAQTVYLAH